MIMNSNVITASWQPEFALWDEESKLKPFWTVLFFSQKKVVLSELFWRRKGLCFYMYYVSRKTAVCKRDPEEPYPFWRPVFQCVPHFLARKWNFVLEWYHSAKDQWDTTEQSNLCVPPETEETGTFIAGSLPSPGDNWIMI